MAAEKKTVPVSVRELRKFAVRLIPLPFGFGLILFRHRWHAYGLWVSAWIPLLALAVAFPRPLKPVRVAALWLSRMLSAVISTIALAVAYVCVMTPLGWLAKRFRKQFLDLQWNPEAKDASYWVPHPPGDPKSAEKQY